jgi:hypothetical protein
MYYLSGGVYAGVQGGGGGGEAEVAEVAEGLPPITAAQVLTGA